MHHVAHLPRERTTARFFNDLDVLAAEKPIFLFFSLVSPLRDCGSGAEGHFLSSECGARGLGVLMLRFLNAGSRLYTLKPLRPIHAIHRSPESYCPSLHLTETDGVHTANTAPLTPRPAAGRRPINRTAARRGAPGRSASATSACWHTERWPTDVCFLWRLGRFLSFISLIFFLEPGDISLKFSLSGPGPGGSDRLRLLAQLGSGGARLLPAQVDVW